MSNDLSATKIDVDLFDLKHTFESAQPLTFHADYDERINSILYTSGKSIINMGQAGTSKNPNLVVVSDDIKFAISDVTKRFRLKDNMRQVYKEINTDKFMARAIKDYEGMRLTLNDPWETTVCYIISQFNNVKRIRGIIRSMINKFGTDVYKNGSFVTKSFPSSETLMNASIKELMSCGTGFRGKYIKSAAEYCTNNLDLYKLNPNNYDNLKEKLMEIDGVGDKVADCIVLMGYGNMQACPIDVWVKRTIEKIYFKSKEKKIDYIHEFVEDRWGKKYLGYAQQYIFWGGRQMEDEAKEYLLVK
ncbi:MAG: DNA-3-methyladenine glycosylase family protein [Candidatus Micrarchaeales archaeon]